jgi:hypothetical protein
VVERVVDDVVHRVVVLLLRLDHARPETAPEDVVAAIVALVEGPRISAVEIAHPVGEIGPRRFDDQVVVISHQAARVDTPAVAPRDAAKDVDEDGAVRVVHDDRRLVVAARRHVVVRAGGEVAGCATHRSRP